MIIRVYTNGCRLTPIGIPVNSEIDYYWYRDDLQWQFVDPDDRVSREYKQRVIEIRKWFKK
jgi:hypothetical protein